MDIGIKTPDIGITGLDRSLRIVSVNDCFLRTFGRSALEMISQSFPGFLHPALGDYFRQQLSLLFEGLQSRISDSFNATRPDNSVVFATMTASLVQSNEGRNHVVVLVRPENFTDGGRARSSCDQVLTALNARILEGVAGGVPAAALASELYLSRQSIDHRVGRMQRLLGVPNRSALVSRAYSLGIFSVARWPPRVRPECVEAPPRDR